ncbi:MAG: endonuclease III [Candidatus Omnitrophota bacterium]|jgi:endonuclease-3|nr:MAG: endonuclease III [Candidatus Omnitrophota bacterium]
MQRQVRQFTLPSVTVTSRTKDPYLVLISCILSLRTKDKVTHQASQRLFALADNPTKMIQLSLKALTRAIYPVGFYRIKAKTILGVSLRLLDDFAGKVPRTLEQLLSLKGVGRKTANLVLGLGFGIPAICVDTHVHRISNRLGWVKTKTPEETEQALMRLIPKNCWIVLNTIMVAFGQHICVPVSPLCSRCTVKPWCAQRAVARMR